MTSVYRRSGACPPARLHPSSPFLKTTTFATLGAVLHACQRAPRPLPASSSKLPQAHALTY